LEESRGNEPPQGIPRRAAYSTPTLFAQLTPCPGHRSRRASRSPAGDRTRDRGHGRTETRTVKAVTLHTPGGIAFPHAQQAVRITRTRTIKARTSRETAYLVTSLPTVDAHHGPTCSNGTERNG
jgi:hypothetical protein